MKDSVEKTGVEQEVVYNTAKIWRLILWPLGEAGRMLFMLLMMFLSFYATGVAGIGVVLVGSILTSTRIFDGLTDPLMGFMIDRTQGKFGKIRPFVIGSYIVMVASAFLIFFTTHHIPEGFRVIYFTATYFVYMIAYSTLGMTLAIANPILTNNPKQRPIIFGLQMIFTTSIGAAFMVYTANIATRYGGFGSATLFQEMLITFTILSAFMITGALIAIWKIDRVENFNTSGKKEKITFRDMIDTLKNNRPLQLFMITNSADRLASNIANNQIINVMLFGIIIGDFVISGTISGIMLIPNILTLLFGIKFIGKLGAKKGYIYSVWGGMIFGTLVPLLLILGDPTLIRFDRIGFMTVAFVVLNFGFNVCRLLSNMCVGPMRPDIIDYETYRSGKFAPGIIVATDSFIDKIITAFSQTFVALVVASIGFKDTLPDLDTPLTTEILAVTLFLGFGVLIIAWIISLICMKFYPLNYEKMVEIQTELKRRSDESKKKVESSDNNSTNRPVAMKKKLHI